MRKFQFFDPDQESAISNRQLPHWAQAGTLTFITWRTADSLPRVLQERLTRERHSLLARMGLDAGGDWEDAVARLPPADRGRVKWALFQQRDALLDSGAGACVLRRTELAAIVEESLRHFDGERYLLTDSVVMPNHLHLLAAFPNEKGS
jgi:putative transposase